MRAKTTILTARWGFCSARQAAPFLFARNNLEERMPRPTFFRLGATLCVGTLIAALALLAGCDRLGLSRAPKVSVSSAPPSTITPPAVEPDVPLAAPDPVAPTGTQIANSVGQSPPEVGS